MLRLVVILAIHIQGPSVEPRVLRQETREAASKEAALSLCKHWFVAHRPIRIPGQMLSASCWWREEWEL